MERDGDLQERIDVARLPWLLRRGVFTAIGLVVLAGLLGVEGPFLIWQVALIAGTTVSEVEIRSARRAKTTAEFDQRMLVMRSILIALVGVGVPLVMGPSWVVPLAIMVVLGSSATQFSSQLVWTLLGVAIASYLGGSVLVGAGVVDPIQPVGVSGAISVPAAVAMALLVFPLVTAFVEARARRAEEARRDLEQAVDELEEAQERLRASEGEAQQLSEQLAAEVERKTEELARRNRALSIVNAISFALSEPFEDDTALERAARLAARLLSVEAVQIRDWPGGANGVEVVSGAVPDVDGLPRLPGEVIDEAIERREGVTRSSERGEGGAVGGMAPYVIVPMVTRGTVRGSLTLIGEACVGWGEQELHLLTLIAREMGAALENAHLYRDAVSGAERERLVTQSSALLADGEPLHEQLDALMERLGEEMQPAFASVTSVEPGAVGAELARWERDGDEPLTAEQLSALGGLIPVRPLPIDPVVTASPDGTPAELAERVGELVIAPILTAQVEAPDGMAAPLEDRERTTRLPAAVLVVGAPSGTGWSDADVELFSRMAGLIGRRLEGEQLVQLQQRRLDELAALAEIGRIIQSGSDVERMLSDFASALRQLVRFEWAYVVRLGEGDWEQVVSFSESGRLREPVAVEAEDLTHRWFTSREVTAWTRESGPVPSFIDDEAQAGLTFPMRPKGQLLGAVILVGPEMQRISARLAERAVEQLALALDSAELYRQATDRASRIEAQRNLAKIVASAVDLRGAFDAFSEEIRWLIPFERAVIVAVDESQGRAEQAALYPPAEDAELASAELRGSVLERVIEAGGAVALPRTDAELAGLEWALLGEETQEAAAVPIRDGEETVAVFAVLNSGTANYAQYDLRALEELAGLLAVTIDRLRLYERAEHAARHDLLTGLPNYRYLQERLTTLQTAFESGRHTAILMVDMDGLKLYNDTLGHEAGDRAIQRVAEELRSAVRGDDLVARTGGDEFVVVMQDVSEADALTVSQRMHDSLRDIHREFGNAPVPVRISVGLALAPEDGTTAPELLEAADRAMYAAKFGGGDRTRAAGGSDELAPRTLRRRGNRVMELLIRSAVDGASGAERLALALAQRYVVAVALGRGLPVDTADPLRMLVAAEAAHHIEAPEGYHDHETALMLLDGLRQQWDEQMDAERLDLETLLPAAVRLAWEQIPAPEGPGLTAEQALTIVTTDPAYPLDPEVLELLSEAALTAAFERRRQRPDAA